MSLHLYLNLLVRNCCETPYQAIRLPFETLLIRQQKLALRWRRKTRGQFSPRSLLEEWEPCIFILLKYVHACLVMLMNSAA